VIRAMTEETIDAIKVSGDNVDLVLVGGGSVILPKDLAGTKSVVTPEFFGAANAIGSAIAKVSGTYEKLISFDEIPREEALRQAKEAAAEMAAQAGADPGKVEIIDVEDTPLAYYSGNTSRVKVKAAGDLR
jgi:N-methylhydantoinase A/oxoprolinase/acetone carboxylase beta subunit